VIVLASGELGMTYGAVYLSLTGYYDHTVSGAGSVQLSALGVALYLAGIKIWDMGQVNSDNNASDNNNDGNNNN
jgi:hypothetical protein